LKVAFNIDRLTPDQKAKCETQLHQKQSKLEQAQAQLAHKISQPQYLARVPQEVREKDR
jgi:hypothetical protein